MKKLLTISLLTLAMVLLIVSCSAENNTVEDELAVISFDAAENATRSLTRTNSVFNSSELYWYYTAEKKDSTGLTTGQTGTSGSLIKTAVNSSTTVNKGLKPVGPFSYGDWEFVLYGCTEADSTKVAYQSEVTKITINKATTALKVFVTAQQTGSGTLVFPLYSKIVELGGAVGGSATLGTDIVERITFNCLSDSSKSQTKYNYETTATEGTRSISLSSGSYSVTFSYLKGVTSTTVEETTTYDDSAAYAVAEETIYVTIRDNQVTTIGGDITENTGEVVPTAVEPEAKIVTTSDDSTTTVFYDSFLDAVEAYSSSETAASSITLLKDVTISESKAFDKNLTIDLGNNILTLASDVVLTVGSSAVTDSNAITVTIKNGTIDGEGYLINDNYNASLKLEDVTFAANRKSTWSGSKIADGSNTGDSCFATALNSSYLTLTEEEKTSATTYINWFEAKFFNTGKASKEERNTSSDKTANNDELVVRIYNADLFASYDLISKYADAKRIVSGNILRTLTIEVEADLDLNNKDWTPIEGKGEDTTNFDFNNHTISNLKIVVETGDKIGLFSIVYMGVIKDLKITKATVSASNSQLVGILAGSVPKTQSISNITVTESTLTGKKYVGVIGGQGYFTDGISNCNIDNVTVTAEEQVGGIFGDFKLGTIENCTVTYSTIIASKNSVGGIAGKPYCNEENVSGTVKLTGNSVSNTTIGVGSDKDNLTATPSSNIGCKENYCGYIAGGRYINATDEGKSNIKYTASGVGTTIIDGTNVYL